MKFGMRNPDRLNSNEPQATPRQSLDEKSLGLIPSGLGSGIGGTWSKAPPPSSKAKKNTLSFHEGLFISALTTCAVQAAPDWT